MRDYTYNASLKGSTVVTINELTAEDIDRYLKTGKTDEKYTDLLLNFLLINDNYELQRCDIFVPYEDHITYLISTDDETIGESLNKTASYYGEEKKFVSKALEVSPDTEFIPEKSARESLYTDNVKDGIKLMTYYMPVFDENNHVIAVFAASYSADKVVKTILHYVVVIMGISLTIMIVSVIIIFLSIRKHITNSITKLTNSVRTMKEKIKNKQAVTMDIHTGDEIEELAVSFENMNKDLISYIDENTKMTAETGRYAA